MESQQTETKQKQTTNLPTDPTQPNAPLIIIMASKQQRTKDSKRTN